MTQDMPNKRFERNMNHNYMILGKCDFFRNNDLKHTDYRVRMLLENSIAGLLPVTHRSVNGESRYYYEINSLQSLDRLLEQKEMNYNELRALLLGCISLFDKLEEYLLDGAQVIMKPEYIYMNMEHMEPYFVYYPNYTGDVRISFMELIDELLAKLNHSDERAVMLGYQVYRYTRNPNYVLSEIRHMMQPMIAGAAESIDSNFYETAYAGEKGAASASAARNAERVVSDAAPNSFGYPCSDSFRDSVHDSFTKAEPEALPEQKESKYTGDLIGAIFCILVAACAAALVAASRILRLFALNADQELYLCGAAAMAGVAAVIFFSCMLKKKRHHKMLNDLCGEPAEGEGFSVSALNDSGILPQPELPFPISNPVNEVEFRQNSDSMGAKSQKSFRNMDACGETICLGSNAIEERILCGRIDGREVSIPLKHLPMTIGKLAGFADFVIPDNAVSKMHARIEERNGRIYLCDLNSTNGTVKNGTLLELNTPVPLEPGDRIRFGRTSFTYC